MRVVDDQRQWRLLREEREQTERRGADGEALGPRRRRAERKGTGQRLRLSRRDPVEMPERGREQLREPGERNLGLGLDPARANHAHAVSLRRRVVEQRGLADPRLADEREHSAAAVARLREEAGEPPPFGGARGPPRGGGRAPAVRRRGPGERAALHASPHLMRAGRPLEKTRCPPDATPPRRPYVRRNRPEEARMSTIEEPVAVDGAKLEQFVFRAVEEVGATLNAALVVMGDKLGLYRAMAGAGGLTPVDLARRTGVSERYVREWL